MKQKLLIGIALFLLHGLAAQPRGVIKPVPGGQLKKGKFHALVVGVSDYENIHDLSFAHRDAGLMADFLKEQIPLLGYQEYQLSTLLNEQATRAAIYRELNALRDPQRCLPGDRVLLYFSGHGDVEAYTGAQYGYFLPYDCPVDNYMGGAIDLEHLKRLILHLIQREVEVVLIMDACRSGELVENYLEPRSVSAILYTLQLDKVVSLLSCRPEELSLEGAQWGGGQGLFSYVLLTGLRGAADADADQQITVREIERYLEDRVPEMARPGEQTPLTVAMDKRLPLAKIVSRDGAPPIATAEAAQPTGTKTPDTAGGARKNELSPYAAFRAALRQGALVRPDSANAFFYYRQLSSEAVYRDSLSSFRGDLVTAMLAEVQPFLNQLYVANPESFPPEAFAPPIQTQEAVLELIDPEDLLYRHLRSDYHFLQGAALSALADDSDEPSLFVAARNAFDKALEINPLAPHAHLWRAYADINLADWEEALSSLGNSLRANPNYSLPYHLLDQLQARQMEAALTAEQNRSKKRRSRKQEKKMKAEAEELLLGFLPRDLLDRERLEAKAEEAVAIISDDYLSPDKFGAIARVPAALETVFVMAPALEERIVNVLGEVAVAAHPLLESIGTGAEDRLAMEEERQRKAEEARYQAEAERQRKEEEARKRKNQVAPSGDPNTANQEEKSSGAGQVGGGLIDRSVLHAPKPDDASPQTGNVVIEVCVDIDGNVIHAAYTQRGSTSANAELIDIALTNAKKWKFSEGKADRQCGTISYEFRLP